MMFIPRIVCMPKNMVTDISQPVWTVERISGVKIAETDPPSPTHADDHGFKNSKHLAGSVVQ